jgi:hypothetical protein
MNFLRDITIIEWFIIAAIALIITAAFASASSRSRLVQQCMEDGRKEYECEAMLRGRYK